MDNEMQQTNPNWYKELQYKDVKVYIRDNINSASRSFVAIGYYLKYVRDNQLFLEDGYTTIWEFAQGEFSIGKSSASRFMAINDRFSNDGNSPILLKQYRDFSSSKLSEMLTMSDDQLEQVNVTTTVAEIREIKSPVKDEVVATSQLEPGTNTCFIKKDLEDGLMCSGGISNNCDTCDRFQPEEQEPEPSNKCIHRPEFPCTLSEAQKVAQGDGEECNKKCCWGCLKHGKCGYECNASAHRPKATKVVSTESEYIETVTNETEENRIPDPDLSCKFDPEARCLIASKESCKRSSDEGCMNCSGGWGEEDYITVEPEHDKPEPVEIIEADIIPTEPVHESMQPELPILRNNDQRKEFIEVYETWPLWIDQELTGERYYRYNLSDKVAMVVKVSLRHIRGYGIQETDEISYGAEQYYLLGIKNEWTSKGTITVEDSSRTFYECSTNKSALVDYLKDFQKKGVNK